MNIQSNGGFLALSLWLPDLHMIPHSYHSLSCLLVKTPFCLLAVPPARQAWVISLLFSLSEKNAVDAPAGNVLVTYDVIANFSALILLDLRSHGSSLSEKTPLALTWSHVPSTSWLHMPCTMCFCGYMYFLFKINNSAINET